MLKYLNGNKKNFIKSLETECAYYKSQGYKYYYLGEAHKYKSKFNGFELLGPL